MSKRGQGLPLNTIILAILALLVLVFVVLFATGAFGTLFGQTQDVAEATETSIVATQTKCSQWCLQAQSSGTNLDWENSKFCKETQLLDTNGDGEAEPYHCYETGITSENPTGKNPIAATCSTTLGGKQVTQANCIATTDTTGG